MQYIKNLEYSSETDAKTKFPASSKEPRKISTYMRTTMTKLHSSMYRYTVIFICIAENISIIDLD